MEALFDKELIVPPTTYEEWLNCFDFLKSRSSIDSGVAMTIAKGSFINSGYLTVRFQHMLVETINEMLNKRIARFLKDFNMLISLNELSDMVPLFIKLRNEVRKCLFFRELEFLEENIKLDLEQSVKTQMEKFWGDTIIFLKKQTLEYSNTDLEDFLFLICRIKLFAETV